MKKGEEKKSFIHHYYSDKHILSDFHSWAFFLSSRQIVDLFSVFISLFYLSPPIFKAEGLWGYILW
jgi:hypothetical protein